MPVNYQVGQTIRCFNIDRPYASKGALNTSAFESIFYTPDFIRCWQKISENTFPNLFKCNSYLNPAHFLIFSLNASINHSRSI
jgi:hypothetical protein